MGLNVRRPLPSVRGYPADPHPGRTAPPVPEQPLLPPVLNERRRGAEMDDVISVSSDESDVEVVGSYVEERRSLITKADPLPLAAAVRADGSAADVTVPPCHIDLTDPQWSFTQLKPHKRFSSACEAVIDLTETDAKGSGQEMDNPLPDVLKLNNESTMENTSNREDFDPQKICTSDSGVLAGVLGNVPEQQHLGFQDKHLKWESEAPTVRLERLERLPFLETYTTGPWMYSVDYVNDSCAVMTMGSTEICKNSKTRESGTDLRTATASNILQTETSPTDDYSPNVVASGDELERGFGRQLSNQEAEQPGSSAESFHSERISFVETSDDEGSNDNEKDAFLTSVKSPFPVYSPISEDDQENELHCSNMEQLARDKAESDQSCHSAQSLPLSLPVGLNSPKPINCNPLSHTSPVYHNVKSEDGPTADDTTEWRSELENYQGVLEIDSPASLPWQDGSEVEDMIEESGLGLDFRAVSEEDRHYVCEDSLKQVMDRSTPLPFDKDDGGFGPPKLLCRRSLSLVSSTIDENYSEGTLELLRDLLQPGFFPPKNITSHLLRGILLDPQCPRHLCVQAFTLLMRTQRHHMAERATVPWDWELLTSVMANQDHTMRHRSEVVRMLLEYIIQTLEDDFRAKRRVSVLHRSIAKTMLSCNQQFPRVRDVIKWLFHAITKATERGESNQTTRDRDEHVRMVSVFQRMLSLALEVDCSPAVHSGKLSQELFHTLLSDMPLRAQRMLLLETLQSKLLRYKLLEHLLGYACPLKTSLPMSVSLLLHFLKNCTLQPDPLDQTEGWQKWEELVHLLWMLLLSYEKAMKNYLCSSVKNQRSHGGTCKTYRAEDMVSKLAVREAVEAFLSRSQADLGQALPLHVEESLTYLQDHLLDTCQC